MQFNLLTRKGHLNKKTASQ